MKQSIRHAKHIHEELIKANTGKQQSDCFSHSNINLPSQIVVPQGIQRKIDFNHLLQLRNSHRDSLRWTRGGEGKGDMGQPIGHKSILTAYSKVNQP